MLPPKIVEINKGSFKNITEKVIAVRGTIYIKADAFSEPNFIVNSKKITVAMARETTETIKKLTQNIQSNEKIDNSLSFGTKKNVAKAEKI